MNTVSLPEVITPLVRRHAEDAAFYWAQHDSSAGAPHLTLSALARLSAMLRAHLEGLEVAGAHAWTHCHAALARWQKPAEAFVCAWVACSSGDPAQLDALLAMLRARPHELLRGVASALAWLPPASARVRIAQWTAPDADGVMAVAALRAAALIGPDADTALAQALAVFLDSRDEHVRAAACRAAAHRGDAAALLEALLDDPMLVVRAEAAIALGRALPGDMRAATVLQACVASQVALAQAASGWYARQAQRRLARWVRHLAMMPVAEADALPAALPSRAALLYIAWRGDPAHLPVAIDHMRQPDTARYAGWVWQTVTGIDLAGAGLAMPEAEPETADTVSAVVPDSDTTLPLPDADAVARYPIGLEAGGRYLAGRACDAGHALHLLMHAPQAVRAIAAGYLLHGSPGLRVPVRACGLTQGALLARLTHEGERR